MLTSLALAEFTVTLNVSFLFLFKLLFNTSGPDWSCTPSHWIPVFKISLPDGATIVSSCPMLPSHWLIDQVNLQFKKMIREWVSGDLTKHILRHFSSVKLMARYKCWQSWTPPCNKHEEDLCERIQRQPRVHWEITRKRTEASNDCLTFGCRELWPDTWTNFTGHALQRVLWYRRELLAKIWGTKLSFHSRLAAESDLD